MLQLLCDCVICCVDMWLWSGTCCRAWPDVTDDTWSSDAVLQSSRDSDGGSSLHVSCRCLVSWLHHGGAAEQTHSLPSTDSHAAGSTSHSPACKYV